MKFQQFRYHFWLHYACRHPDDGVPAGHKAGNYRHHAGSVYISQYVATSHGRSGAVGIFLGVRKGQKGDVASYLPALRRELGPDVEIGGESGSNAVHYINVFDCRNWDAMADWLSKKLRAYRRALGQGTRA